MVGRPVWSASVATAFLMLGACQTGSSSEAIEGAGTTTASPLTEVAPIGGSAGVSGELPLDWFTRLQSDIGRLETELYFGFMERCMADAGFSWEAPVSPPVPAEWEEISRYPVRYGLVTLVQAERAAYQSPEEVILGAGGENSEEEALPDDSAEREAFLAAWSGVRADAPPDLVSVLDPLTGEPIAAFDASLPDGGGCQGRANVWLAGGPRSTEGADVTTDRDAARIWIDTRSRAAFEAALADTRVVSTVAEWRDCMGRSGWDLPDWRLPGGLTVPDPATAASEERAEFLSRERDNLDLAVADVTCQQEVDWLTRLRAVEAEYQQETVERVPDLFAKTRELLEAYAARLTTLRLEIPGQ